MASVSWVAVAARVGALALRDYAEGVQGGVVGEVVVERFGLWRWCCVPWQLSFFAF